MTSLDNLFRGYSSSSSSTPMPAGGHKRKYPGPPTHDVSNLYQKTAKLTANGSPHTSSAQDYNDGDEDDDGISAGPARPPENGVTADEEEEETVGAEDEDGRFFGGGVSANTRDAMDYVDGADGEDGTVAEEVIDGSWLKRMAVGFEKKISKNAELRGRFEGEPEKFVASEADLDADIKALSILSEHPELYPDFVKLGSVGSLVALLVHENTDIAIDTIEVLRELTDDDVSAEEVQWKTLVDAMLDADLVDLLTQNLARLDEEVEGDREGVYHVLGMVENLASQQSIADSISVKNEGLLRWLLGRIQKKESKLGQNKQYAAEVLEILLQSSSETRSVFAGMDGIDVLLQLLSAYRRKDPEKDSDEAEYVENLFDCLVCMLVEPVGKEKFIAAEGIELCLIMLREGKLSKSRALRVLDHALCRSSAVAVCERFIEAAGLKTIFAMFMKKQEREATEHLLGIFSSLLRLLPGQSAGRIRTLAKFVEKDYEKIEKLIGLRRSYSEKVSAADGAINIEQRDLNDEERVEMAGRRLSRRLDAGLFSLQNIDVILSWLISEDSGARARTRELLAESNRSLEDLKKSLRERLDGSDAEQGEDGVEMKDMLETLLECF